MNFKFEIKNQLGYAREGKVSLDGFSFTTPNFVVPINKKIITEFQPFLSKIIKISNDPQDKMKKYLAGLKLDSYLSINSSNHKSDIKGNAVESDASGSLELLHPFFSETKKLWGFDTENQKGNKIPNQCDDPDSIQILNENFPNSNLPYYDDYQYASLDTRLNLYEELLFPKNPDQKYIIEFKFTKKQPYLKRIIEWIQKNQKSIVGIKIDDIFANLMNFNLILDWIFKLKSKLPFDLLWVVGGQIFPQDYALATYLGFDLIDTRKLLLWGIKGLYISDNGRKWIREIKYPQCPCSACQSLSKHLPAAGKESIEIRRLILQHNLQAAFAELWRIKEGISDKTLRTYIEAKIHVNPLSASMLRVIDRQYGDRVNKRYPLIGSNSIKCIGVESYSRPEVVNFINRVKSEIIPAKKYVMVVILPCASKKPYSDSKSHQFFQKSIKRSSQKLYSQIHQVIITSPLGVIPREIESIFPAAHYDIPVTGEWDPIEVETTAECLVSWLKKYDNLDEINIIAHVSGGYRESCKRAINQLNESLNVSVHMDFTLPDNYNESPSSKNSLLYLSDKIREIAEEIKNQSKIEPKTEISKISKALNTLTSDEIVIRATLDYQLGKGAGDLITDMGAIRIKGKNPNFDDILVYDGAGKIKVGRLYADSGFIKLAPRGAELIIEHSRNKIVIDDEVLRGTTVFRPILHDLDRNSHPGDEMIVVNKTNQYLGVGELIQNPEDILNSRKGWVCKLRKKVKTSKTKSNK
jgi:archaeosine synthase alpha-subunit